MGACRSSNLIRVHHPNRVDGWINQAECLCELHGAEKAVEALLLDEERFNDSAFDSVWDSFYKGMVINFSILDHTRVKDLKIITILALAFLHVSCTSYRRDDYFNYHGFVDKRLGRDTFKITYNGRLFIDLEKAIDFCLLRCSEITLERGYKYFRVTESNNGIYPHLIRADSHETITAIPLLIANTIISNVEEVVAVNIIVCKKTPPPNSNEFYSAEKIRNLIRDKYGMPK